MIKNSPRRSVSLRRISAETRRPRAAPSAIIIQPCSRDIRSAALKRRSDFICVRSPAGFPDGSFDRFRLAGLVLICLKNETTVAPSMTCPTYSLAGVDVAEKARRETLLRHLESADKAQLSEAAKYSLERAGADWSEDIKQ